MDKGRKPTVAQNGEPRQEVPGQLYQSHQVRVQGQQNRSQWGKGKLEWEVYLGGVEDSKQE